ncbi:hypothetical protein CPB83DRAFT_899697 [Crepidotus variabilis]|uniref:Haemolytic enterotoxin (HBL) n=1 Tax=Crepidotus variabilis TaxID=179855 RepID=A0A9P6E4J4_9AGAR|nr:hypothetical protein CPB83DRAFT_899697 [Crepidotus variabilis]
MAADLLFGGLARFSIQPVLEEFLRSLELTSVQNAPPSTCNAEKSLRSLRVSIQYAPPPPYNAGLYPAFDLPGYTSKNPDSEEARVLVRLTNAIKEYGKFNPGDIQNRIAQSIKQVDAAETLDDLTNHIMAVNTSFEKVGRALGDLDREASRKKYGNANERFSPAWGDIHEDFKKQVAISGEVAMEAAMNAKYFRTVLIPILESSQSLSLDDKKSALEFYIKALENSKTAAQEMSSSFIALPARVQDIQTRLEVAFSAIGEMFNKKIEGLKAEIEQLNKQVREYSDIARTAMWIGLGGATVMGAGALLALTGILAPVATLAFWGGAAVGLGGGIGSIVASEQAQAAKNERDVKIQELKQLTQDVTSFNDIQANVKLAMRDCPALCIRLNTIGSIWAVIRTESQLILDSMIKAQNANTKWASN